MERLADYLIIAAGPGDALALAETHVRAWRETYPGLLPQQYLDRMSPVLHARRWRRQLSSPGEGDVVLAAEGPEGIVGYCAGSIGARADAGAAEVFTLYLLRGAQGDGLGRRLLSATARVLTAKGARRLDIWVLSGNERAKGFYAHLGGRQAAERASAGWGGRLRESLYRWPDISVLF